jgi:hypothetical protein
MVDHISNRNVILNFLRSELVGPNPQGEEIDTKLPINIEKKELTYEKFRELATGEEILFQESPQTRYGVGALYPSKSIFTPTPYTIEDFTDQFSEQNNITDENIENTIKNVKKIEEKIPNINNNPEPYDLDVPTPEIYKPSSIGVSFFVELLEKSDLIVDISGGRYRPINVVVQGQKQTWHVRSEVKQKLIFSGSDFLVDGNNQWTPKTIEQENTQGLNLSVEIKSRGYLDEKNRRLLTVSLVNRSIIEENDVILFQTKMKVTVLSKGSDAHILPYPRPTYRELDAEEASIDLLYREAETYGIGHGCSADWDKIVLGQKVKSIIADPFPMIELPSTTPDIEDEFGNPIEVNMNSLAGLVNGDNGFASIEKVISNYVNWIVKKSESISKLPSHFEEAAQKHIKACEISAERMKGGLTILRNNKNAFKAFQLANQAILLQQLNSNTPLRKLSVDQKTQRVLFSSEYTEPDPKKNQRFWRAFQIAFILMNVESIIYPNSDSRNNVELIWFPTGGGKTEAYLGLAALSMFYRRICNQDDIGTDILMRYTLRLLTAQQFVRASRLICAMEYLRLENIEVLGKNKFTIGLWVGSNNTPNTNKDAVSTLSDLQRHPDQTSNKFIISQCPWCNAQLGIIDVGKKNGSNTISKKMVIGYERAGNTVVFRCSDQKCHFFKNLLPIKVIDEDIYNSPPTLLIGTVDKFAMLTWRSEPRSLFGIGHDGNRENSPPTMIIQDELHLISGPLGTMVGLYEVLIEELCTDRRNGFVLPKIISSTATIRNYADQVKNLFGREKVSLFPPPGLEINDSFFAKYATDKNGNLKPGRMYIGAFAPGLGSGIDTQTRTVAALLQAPMILPDEAKDPWWTLLMFFNSLKELGTTLSLIETFIPDYQRILLNRFPLKTRNHRNHQNILELTGRASDQDIPKAISNLEKPFTSLKDYQTIDACLASNILEVGVDIERLSIMTILSQPKTTSQYIQVSGRIGRSWWKKPGLVVTIFSPTRPRDRSHFEQFRSYHERLYSHVEPTSVTPFSPPALERALHSIIVAYVQQFGNQNEIGSPYPIPRKLLEQIRKLVLDRVMKIDPDEISSFTNLFNKRETEWENWERVIWKKNQTDDSPLLWPAGQYIPEVLRKVTWQTMQSMRNVDAECLLEIPIIKVEGDINAEQT